MSKQTRAVIRKLKQELAGLRKEQATPQLTSEQQLQMFQLWMQQQQQRRRLGELLHLRDAQLA